MGILLVESYKNLKIWKRSMNFVTAIYSVSSNFPKEEKFGLMSQIRRAAVSIPSNIAEGSCKTTNRDFRRFLTDSLGSASEVETQLQISRNLKYISNDEHIELEREIIEIEKMISSFISKMIV